MSLSEHLIRSKPASGRRNLLVVRAGDGSLHPSWLTGPHQRDFDLLISYFGSRPNQFREAADHYHVMAGPRWPAHDLICRDHPALIAHYDHVCFACDDLIADLATWNELFKFCHTHSLDLAQPAVRGPTAYRFTAPVESCLYRITTYVENMCPVFSRRALAVCRETFGESISGWGLSHAWPQLLAPRGWTLAIIDAITTTHSRDVGEGSLYPLLISLGVNAMAEKHAVMAHYGVKEPDMRELARVVLPTSTGTPKDLFRSE